MKEDFMKKIVGMLSVLFVLSTAVFANGLKDSGGAAKIGVSMPTQSLQRWNQDGANMKAQLETAGYKVDLQYAGDNDIATQVSQLENMITGNCKALVIASIDGSALTNVLKEAKAKKIPVIAYDRLIMNSDAVTYYATFDNYKVGKIQGEYIRDKLKLDSTNGPYNIELFTGAPDDNNVNFFFGGAMDVLTPYIKSGKLVVKSGQVTKAQCATPNWSTEEAQKRMEDLIIANGYGPKGVKLDAVYSSNDSVANGITNALKAAGYTKDNFPIITGQDCDKPAVKNMIAGTQSMSIFKDTRTLASKVVGMVNAIMKGTKVEINDTKTYNNGVRIVPSYLCDPVFATVDNYKALLIDSGYYKPQDLQ
jgi:putative multiple sugar transport system substrate-binding protein